MLSNYLINYYPSILKNTIVLQIKIEEMDEKYDPKCTVQISTHNTAQSFGQFG